MIGLNQDMNDFARNVGRECGVVGDNPKGDSRLARDIASLKFPSLLARMTDEQRRKIKTLATAAVAGGGKPYWEAFFHSVDRLIGDAAYQGVKEGQESCMIVAARVMAGEQFADVSDWGTVGPNDAEPFDGDAGGLVR